MTVVIIKTGPVEPTITYLATIRVQVDQQSSEERVYAGLTVGIPEKRAKKQPIQDVAKIVSTAPIRFLVLVPYTAPNVRVGAMTVININSETAMVRWFKFVISSFQWVPMVFLTSEIRPRPHGLPGSWVMIQQNITC